MKMIKLKKLKNNAPFRLYTSKFNSILIHNAGDLDVVMLMCNLLKIQSKLFYDIRNFMELLQRQNL